MRTHADICRHAAVLRQLHLSAAPTEGGASRLTEVADTQEARRRKKKVLHMQGGAYGISGELALEHHKEFAGADTISKTQGVGVVTGDPLQQRGGGHALHYQGGNAAEGAAARVSSPQVSAFLLLY